MPCDMADLGPDRHSRRPSPQAGSAGAGFLSGLGVRFAKAGHPARALPVTGEAVAIPRDRAAASPSRYRPGLTRSLSRLAGILVSAQ